MRKEKETDFALQNLYKLLEANLFMLHSETDVEKMMPLVVILKERKTFIAWSPLLDESGEGDTEMEATEELREAIRVRLQDTNMPIPRDVEVRAVVSHASMRVEPVMNHAKAFA